MALLAALAQIQWPRPSTYIHYYTYMYIYKALIRLCVCVCWVLRMRPVFTVLLTAFLSSNCNELHELALERKKKLLPLPLLLLLHEIPFWPRICSQPKVLPVFHYFFSSPHFQGEGWKKEAGPHLLWKTSRVCRCLTVLASATAATATATATAATSTSVGPSLLFIKIYLAHNRQTRSSCKAGENNKRRPAVEIKWW